MNKIHPLSNTEGPCNVSCTCMMMFGESILGHEQYSILRQFYEQRLYKREELPVQKEIPTNGTEKPSILGPDQMGWYHMLKIALIAASQSVPMEIAVKQ